MGFVWGPMCAKGPLFTHNSRPTFATVPHALRFSSTSPDACVCFHHDRHAITASWPVDSTGHIDLPFTFVRRARVQIGLLATSSGRQTSYSVHESPFTPLSSFMSQGNSASPLCFLSLIRIKTLFCLPSYGWWDVTDPLVNL